MTTKTQLTLEDKLLRLKSIHQQLESGSVPLTQSMVLLEEALKIKQEVEKELQSMQNKLVDLTKLENSSEKSFDE
jgi:exodeoxyribonuclease VII small subunit